MILTPPSLKSNDTVAIVATARHLKKEELHKAIETFESWGLKVKLGTNLWNVSGQFAGTDNERLNDLQQMIDDPEVRAVFCARGGYGTTRIIDRVDFTSLSKSLKWIVGFSDITAILCHLHALQIESIHSIMPALFGRAGAENDIESLKNILFGNPEKIVSQAHHLNRAGKAKGQLIGGNLSIINNIIGTASDIDTTGKILFIEDVDEYLYHIDRMMVHLKRANKLADLSGLVVGKMTDMRDNTIPFGKTAYEIIHEHVREYNYPVCFDFPVGHEVSSNIALPCGRQAELLVSIEEVILDFTFQ